MTKVEMITEKLYRVIQYTVVLDLVLGVIAYGKHFVI